MKTSINADTCAVTAQAIVPKRLAHFVIRTNRFVEMLAWYRAVFHAKISFENPVIAFLADDDEHHHFAFLNTAQLQASDQLYTGFDHVAFTYAGLLELLSTYERLKGENIKPWTTTILLRKPLLFFIPRLLPPIRLALISTPTLC